MRWSALLIALALMLPGAPLFAQQQSKAIPTTIVFEAKRFYSGPQACEIFGKPRGGANCPIELEIRGHEYRPIVLIAYTGELNYGRGPSEVLRVNRNKPLKVEGLDPAMLNGLAPPTVFSPGRTLIVWGYWSKATNTFGVIEAFRSPGPAPDEKIKHY